MAKWSSSLFYLLLFSVICSFKKVFPFNPGLSKTHDAPTCVSHVLGLQECTALLGFVMVFRTLQGDDKDFPVAFWFLSMGLVCQGLSLCMPPQLLVRWFGDVSSKEVPVGKRLVGGTGFRCNWDDDLGGTPLWKLLFLFIFLCHFLLWCMYMNICNIYATLICFIFKEEWDGDGELCRRLPTQGLLCVKHSGTMVC